MARIKKEDPFYTMFKEFGVDIVACAEDYDKLVNGYPETASMIPLIKVHEDRCDAHVRGIMQELYASFVTPFDRDDISDLALRLDDVVDGMEAVSIRFDLFNMSGTRVEAQQMAALTLAACRELRDMLDYLPNYKTDKRCMEKSIAVGQIEDQADDVYERALRRLFHEEDLEDKRRGHVVGWLRLFDRMELAIDSCDHAAGVVRNVIMKSS